MLSRLFHRPDEAHMHRLPNTLSCRRWWNVLLPAPVWDFFTKKGNGKLVAAWGDGGVGVGVTRGGSGGEKSVGERERETEWKKEREDVHIWSCSMLLSLGGSACGLFWEGAVGEEVTASRKGRRGLWRCHLHHMVHSHYQQVQPLTAREKELTDTRSWLLSYLFYSNNMLPLTLINLKHVVF